MDLTRFYDTIEEYRRLRFRRLLHRALRIVALLASVAIMIAMMLTVYDEWSMYGDYTVWHFAVSFFIYGTFSAFVYFAIDYLLGRIFKED